MNTKQILCTFNKINLNMNIDKHLFIYLFFGAKLFTQHKIVHLRKTYKFCINL